MSRSVYFLIYDNIEVLDFTGPFDVFSNANSVAGNQPFDLKTVSPREGSILARENLEIVPTTSLEKWAGDDVDMFVIPGGNPPGGFGAEHPLLGDDFPIVDKWVKAHQSKMEIIATICVGAIIGAELGIFEGKTVTTHKGVIQNLKDRVGNTANVVSDVRYTDNPGKPRILTSTGVAAGIDLAFYIVEFLLGKAIMEGTMEFMQYRPGYPLPKLPE